MAMDFPSSPAIGAIYQAPGGPAYKWNGTLWEPMTGAAALIVPGRNKIINGNMRLNQRGVDNTAANSGFPADRWFFAFSFTGMVMVRATSGGVSLQGPCHLYIQTTTAKPALAATDYTAFGYRIEGYDAADLLWGTANAKPLTISFRAQAAVETQISVTVNNFDSSRTYAAPVAVKQGVNDYQVTIPGCTTGVWQVGNGIGLQILFTVVCGTTYTAPQANAWLNANYVAAPGQSNIADTLNRFVGLTDVQAEVGLTKTPFETVSFSDLLARCQRYYQKSYGLEVAPGTAGGLALHGALHNVAGPAAESYTAIECRYPIHMRENPGITLYSPVTGAAGKARAINSNADVGIGLYTSGQSGFGANTSGTALTAYETVTCHYASSAEL